MAKKCKIPNCGNVPFNNKHGYCIFHAYKARISTKIKRESKYTRQKKKLLKTAYFGFKSQIEVFDNVWEAEPHICFLTKSPLRQKDIRMFAHVLRKGQYTYFKLNPGNIRLLQPYVHDAVDNYEEGYEEKYPEIDFQKWFDLQEEMKIKYKEFKDKNLLA